MKGEEKNMPSVNQRIRLLIDTEYKGRVRAFCLAIGYTDSQKVNRLFKIDSRNGQYPKVSMTILNDISNKLDISLSWLMRGEGSMRSETSAQMGVDDDLRARYDILDAEYIAISKDLREANKEIKELRMQLDEAREAKRAADARIVHLETLLATQKKSTERPSAGSRYGDSPALSPTNNL